MLNNEHYYWELEGGDKLDLALEIQGGQLTNDERELAKADFSYALNAEMIVRDHPPVELVWRQGIELIEGGFTVLIKKGWVTLHPLEEGSMLYSTGGHPKLWSRESFRLAIEKDMKKIYREG